MPSSISPDSLFGRFLSTSFPVGGPGFQDRREAVEAIQEYAGYTLITGSPNEQVAHLWRGQGGNGKGVMKALISRFHEKAAAVNLEELDGFGIQQLLDATLAVVDETPKSFSPERLKSLVSGDPMLLNRKFRDPIPDFRCGARWIINSNQDFGIRSVDSSPGFFRRFIIIDWTATPGPGEKISGLENLIFAKEAPQVLDWLLTGLLRYLGNGHLFVPEASHRFKTEAMAAADSVVSFIDDHGGPGMVQGPNDKCMLRGTVYEKYREYCDRTGRQSLADNAFWRRMSDRLGEALNTETGSSRKNGVRERYTNIDLNKGSGSSPTVGRHGLSVRKSATLKELYGLTEVRHTPVFSVDPRYAVWADSLPEIPFDGFLEPA